MEYYLFQKSFRFWAIENNIVATKFWVLEKNSRLWKKLWVLENILGTGKYSGRWKTLVSDWRPFTLYKSLRQTIDILKWRIVWRMLYLSWRK